MVALLANPAAAQDIVVAKLASTTTLATFIKACLCGGIIYGCVAAHKIKNDLLVILFVAAFILCGAEHSIADICYFAAARAPLIPSAIYTLIVVLGNAVGAQVFRRVHLTEKEF
jgi:formate/nitrite transporter FocA (FNT family)